MSGWNASTQYQVSRDRRAACGRGHGAALQGPDEPGDVATHPESHGQAAGGSCSVIRSVWAGSVAIAMRSHASVEDPSNGWIEHPGTLHSIAHNGVLGLHI